MMARSGGFHVPADYFRSSAMPAPVPGAPPSVMAHRPRLGLYAMIAGVTAVVAIAIVVLVRPSTTTAQPPAAIVANANVTPPSAASAAAPADSATAAPAATKQVLLAVQPIDAKVTRDGQDLGSSPIAIALKDGEVATLVAKRAGYRDQTIAVDGTQPKMLVKLAAVPAARGTGRGKAAPQQPSTGIGDFQDPFLKK
jgi:serine/threonine-protein kinase